MQMGASEASRHPEDLVAAAPGICSWCSSLDAAAASAAPLSVVLRGHSLYTKYIRNALTDPLGQLESSHVECIGHHTPMRAHENFGGIHALLRQQDNV